MTDLPNPDGGHTVYSITVHPIGEDGDTIVAFGHIDQRRFLAACNHFARVYCGYLNLYEDLSTLAADALTDVDHIEAWYDPSPVHEHDWYLYWTQPENEGSKAAYAVPLTIWRL